MSLTDEQVAANRDQGQQALDGMLALFPKEMAERVNVNVEGRSWQMPIDGGTTLDVSNSVSWSLTFECRNEEMALKEFKYRTGTR